jgi:hypothetical protein
MSTLTQRSSQTEPKEIPNGLLRFASLPDWLTAIADPARVRTALARTIPEFASGALTLLDCDVKRVRIKKDRWTAMYALSVDGLAANQKEVRLRGTLIPPGQETPQQAADQMAFGTEGWRFYLPELRLNLESQPPDEALPSLPRLTEPAAARELLEASIRAGSPAYRGFQIQAVTPKVMRYKPGSRCTILYRLEYPAAAAASGDWPDIVVAKTYKGDKGQNAYDGMRALWESALATSSNVTIAEPLAFVPELNVLVQGPIREEQTLKEMIRSALRSGTAEALEELNHYMRMSAIGLAEMHRCDVGIGELRTWDDELAEVREVDGELAAVIPELRGAAEPLLARLMAIAADNPADPTVPTHGTFRPAQVLIHKGRIGFIDFDGFCQAEPALDLALFLGKIRDIGLSAGKDDDDEDDAPIDREVLLARLAQTEAICEVFLSEYEKHAPVSRQRIALWEVLDLFTLVQHCWTKVKPVRLNTNMLLLERYLSGMGLW